jgi:hypothetical protein
MDWLRHPPLPLEDPCQISPPSLTPPLPTGVCGAGASRWGLPPPWQEAMLSPLALPHDLGLLAIPLPPAHAREGQETSSRKCWLKIAKTNTLRLQKHAFEIVLRVLNIMIAKQNQPGLCEQVFWPRKRPSAPDFADHHEEERRELEKPRRVRPFQRVPIVQ